MKRPGMLHALCLSAASLGASSASASSFQLMEQNASGLGNAYAGSAAIAENASTIFFNPAGMTLLKDNAYSLGVTAIDASYTFSNNRSSALALTAAGTGGNAGTTGFVPNAYWSTAIGKDLYFGIGIGAPFGLKTEYDNPWIGAAQSIKFDIKTINVNPSIAWRVNEQLSVGFGLDWQKFDAEYVRLAGILAPPPGVFPPLTSTQVKLKAHDDAWGWNAGLMYQVSPATRIGISYRSQVEFKLDGDIAVSGPVGAINAAGSSSARATVKLPDTLILSTVHTLDSRWQMLGDLSWTGWSSIPKLDIIRASGAGNGTIAQTLDSSFRDTWRVALGTIYAYDADTKLKFGVAFDRTPTPDAQHRLVSLPDNNRLWLSAGAQWKAGQNATLDLGVTYLYLKDPEISNNQGTAPAASSRGLVDGKFKASAWLFGFQYSSAF